jgi:hypothetical protein
MVVLGEPIKKRDYSRKFRCFEPSQSALGVARVLTLNAIFLAIAHGGFIEIGGAHTITSHSRRVAGKLAT